MKHFIVLSVLLFSLKGFAQLHYKTIFAHANYNKYYALWDSFANDIDSLPAYRHIQLVQELEQLGIATNDSCIQFMSTYYNNYAQLKLESDTGKKLGALRQLAARASQLKLIKLQSAIIFNMIDVYEKNENYLDAYTCYLQMDELVEKWPIIFNDRYIYSQYALGKLLYRFEDYNLSNHRVKGLYSQTKRPLNRILIADLVGNCYLKMHQYDSAFVWFSKINLNIPHESDVDSDWKYSAWHGIVDGNAGIIAKEKGDNKNAILLLRWAVIKCEHANLADNVSKFSNPLALIYIATNNEKEAKWALQQNYIACQKINHAPDWCNYYSAMAQYCGLTHNMQQLNAVGDSLSKYQLLKDAIINQDKKNGLILKQRIKEIKLEKSMLLFKAKRLILIRNFIIALACLLIIIVIILIRKHTQYKLLVKMNDYNRELDNKRNMLIAETKISEFIYRLREKTDLIDTLEAKLEAIGMAPVNPAQTASSSILEDLRTTCILTDVDWEKFRKQFETIYPGFIHQLKIFNIKLSPAEIRFIVLSKLKLNNKEMGGLLGVGADAIRVVRSRFKKKLDDGHFTLESLLQ